MKKIIYFFCSLFLLLFCAPALAVPAEVGYIVDGDTFAARVMLDDDIKISVRVRIANIDTPEINGECDSEIMAAVRAKDRLSEIIPIGTIVKLSNVKDDKYLGRIDAYVKTPAGKDVGEMLIKEKLGRKYSGGRRASWCE